MSDWRAVSLRRLRAVFGGAQIIRVHDVKETYKAIRVADAIRFGVSGPER